MIEPSLYEKFHWAIFNLLAKAFAFWMVFVCFVFVLLVVASVVGKPVGAQYPAWLLVPLVPLLMVGVLMIRAKPYYPEKYKEWYESKHNKGV